MESIEKNLNNDDHDQTTLMTNNKRKQGEIFQGQKRKLTFIENKNIYQINFSFLVSIM
jgi:hypothetical protein